MGEIKQDGREVCLALRCLTLRGPPPPLSHPPPLPHHHHQGSLPAAPGQAPVRRSPPFLLLLNALPWRVLVVSLPLPALRSPHNPQPATLASLILSLSKVADFHFWVFSALSSPPNPLSWVLVTGPFLARVPSQGHMRLARVDLGSEGDEGKPGRFLWFLQ